MTGPVSHAAALGRGATRALANDRPAARERGGAECSDVRAKRGVGG